MKSIMLDQDKIFRKIDKKMKYSEALWAAADLYRRKVHNVEQPKPQGKKRYVGIEVECYSPMHESAVMALVLDMDLEKYVNISFDGSIDGYPKGCIGYEFRILSTEKELPKVLKKLDKFFKQGKFKTNETCGLHVHLDMRYRNVEKCYQKLLKFQHIMFGMVNSDRWETEYTGWSSEDTKFERMTAVNLTAYREHKTIEVRLHEGTTNVKKIGNWVNLLLKALDRPDAPEVESKAEAVKWAGKDKKMKDYIKKTFSSYWIKEKSGVIAMDDYSDPQFGDVLEEIFEVRR